MAKKTIAISSSPRSYSKKMLGLGQEIWKDIDPLEYIRRERSNWDKKIKELDVFILK
jgi:hypothetical protein